MSKRLFSTLRVLQHENPLGLPRSAGTPPNLAARMQRNLPQKRRIPHVKRVIAVSSAKGGVGKSTIAANLALAFARLGHRAGILDTDLFGPSIPTLFNLKDAEQPRLTSENRLIPLPNYGVSTMSISYLLPPSADPTPVVWRGLMVTKALQQLLHEVDWSGGSPSSHLDILVLDLPPGTGDVQLTITQQAILDGAVLVSTPQGLALQDALKGFEMFKKVDVNVLGLVQNMSGFVCPKCGEVSQIFGSEGAAKEARNRGLEVLADVPLDARVCSDADSGAPTVVAEPGSERAKVFLDAARRLGEKIEL